MIFNSFSPIFNGSGGCWRILQFLLFTFSVGGFPCVEGIRVALVECAEFTSSSRVLACVDVQECMRKWHLWKLVKWGTHALMVFSVSDNLVKGSIGNPEFRLVDRNNSRNFSNRFNVPLLNSPSPYSRELSVWVSR